MTYLTIKIFANDGKIKKYFYNMAVEAIVEDEHLEFCHHRNHFYLEAIADVTKDGSTINVDTKSEFEAVPFKEINKASQTNEPYVAINPPKSHLIENFKEAYSTEVHL